MKTYVETFAAEMLSELSVKRIKFGSKMKWFAKAVINIHHSNEGFTCSVIKATSRQRNGQKVVTIEQKYRYISSI